MRFQPPALDLPRDAAWALVRAFGPRETAAPRPADPAAAFATARRLGLEDRIGRRQAPASLAAELGEPAAMSFVLAGVSATRQNARLAELLAIVRTALRSRGIGFLPLKLAALQCLGVTPLRTAVDVDVLVEPGEVPAAVAALEAAGLRRQGEASVDHHAAPLEDPLRGVVEVHRELPCVSGAKPRGFARLSDLARSGHVERSEDGGACPSVALVAAHSLAHALVQHGFAPQGYHLLRFVSDLADLGRPLERRGLREQVARLTRGFVQQDELAAATALCGTLAAGVLPEGDSGALRLLRHCVLGALSPAYQRTLPRRAVLFPALPGPRPVAIARAALEMAFPRRATMERLERRRLTGAGLMRSRLGRLARLALGRPRAASAPPAGRGA